MQRNSSSDCSISIESEPEPESDCMKSILHQVDAALMTGLGSDPCGAAGSSRATRILSKQFTRMKKSPPRPGLWAHDVPAFANPKRRWVMAGV